MANNMMGADPSAEEAMLDSSFLYPPTIIHVDSILREDTAHDNDDEEDEEGSLMRNHHDDSPLSSAPGSPKGKEQQHHHDEEWWEEKKQDDLPEDERMHHHNVTSSSSKQGTGVDYVQLHASLVQARMESSFMSVDDPDIVNNTSTEESPQRSLHSFHIPLGLEPKMEGITKTGHAEQQEEVPQDELLPKDERPSFTINHELDALPWIPKTRQRDVAGAVADEDPQPEDEFFQPSLPSAEEKPEDEYSVEEEKDSFLGEGHPEDELLVAGGDNTMSLDAADRDDATKSNVDDDDSSCSEGDLPSLASSYRPKRLSPLIMISDHVDVEKVADVLLGEEEEASNNTEEYYEDNIPSPSSLLKDPIRNYEEAPLTEETTTTTYRELTPKKDLLSSEASADWLAKEFQRRSIMKQEINKAILARGAALEAVASKESERSSSTPLEGAASGDDDDPVLSSSLPLPVIVPPVNTDSSQDKYPEEDEASTRRVLQYMDSTEGTADNPIRVSLSPVQHEEEKSQEPVPNYAAELERFVTRARADLRRESSMANLSAASGFRSIAQDKPTSATPAPHEAPAALLPKAVKPSIVRKATSASSVPSIPSSGSDFAEVQGNLTPVLIDSMDSVLGILPGDISLSLLNESNGRDDEQKATWAGRVHSAIWRCRRMRRDQGGLGGADATEALPPGSPSRGRSSLPVDLDQGRVAGGVRSVGSTQEAALRHLLHDEVDEALELYEDIIFAYYAYFEKSLKARMSNTAGQETKGVTDFKPYLGVALHNLGILNLLKGDYSEALSFFTRAERNRRSCLGEGHPDHVSSMVKWAVCLYALDDFASAHLKFDEALVLARKQGDNQAGRGVQVAEILNNLGCLMYMCGQPLAAKKYFNEALDCHLRSLSLSLYGDSTLLCHSISLNISITRANIGFIDMISDDVPMAIVAFEAALMEQQLLLHRPHDTIVATMDHLAVANLLCGKHEKAAAMFGRILQLQYKAFGMHDEKCFSTVEKIKMVKNRGPDFENALEQLRTTFSMPKSNNAPPPKVSNRSTRQPRPAKSHNRQVICRSRSSQSSGEKQMLASSSDGASRMREGDKQRGKGGRRLKSVMSSIRKKGAASKQ